MRGRITGQSNLFVKINLEELVPAGHPLRAIKRLADEALSRMGRTFAAAYSPLGRPGIPPERLLKQFGGLRRARVVGRWKIQQLADIGLATLNLVRMSRLLA